MDRDEWDRSAAGQTLAQVFEETALKSDLWCARCWTNMTTEAVVTAGRVRCECGALDWPLKGADDDA